MIKYVSINILIFIIFIQNSPVFAQHLTISGKVLNSNNKPLPYTNIQIKNTGIGTISDKNGNFYLKIPEKYSGNPVQFSFMGYKTKSVQAIKISNKATIYLKAEDKKIDEIIVMPDSTLLTLLEKAYKKIPDNYPGNPTKLRGFYREFIKIPDSNYLYFSEAVIETYKPAYKKNSAEGQVKIIKSVINEFPDLDSLSSRFYGGFFDADRGDIVKYSYSFIKPKYFKNYHYSLYRMTKYEGRNVYVIDFDTKNDSLKGTLKGRFYIDKASLAYISFIYESTPRGLKKYNKENIGINAIKYNNKANYVFYNGKWHYKYSKSKRLFYENKKLYSIVTEYITTKIYTDTVKPFAFEERADYHDFFSEKAKHYYSDDYWQEYNILKKDSFIENSLIQLYDTCQSKKILTQKTEFVKQNQLIKLLSRFNFIYGITYFPIKTEQAIYKINYDNTINFTHELNKISYSIALLMQLEYKINYRWVFNFAMNGTFGDKFKTETYQTGMSYNVLLNKKTNPFILRLSMYYSYNKFIRYFPEYQNNHEFEFGGKTINADILQFGIGNTTHNVMPQISIEHKIKGRSWLYLAFAYNFPFYQNEKLFLNEASGSIFSRKNTDINLNNNNLQVEYNGEPTTKSHVNFNNYLISLGVLIKF
jgi:hypothetical protein